MPPAGSTGGEADAPTSKQVGFAEQIATRKGVEIPPETLRSRSSLSKWLDTHAGTKTGTKKKRKSSKSKPRQAKLQSCGFAGCSGGIGIIIKDAVDFWDRTMTTYNLKRKKSAK